MNKLNSLGGTLVTGTAINNAGQVAGYTTTASAATHAALWNGNSPTDIDPGVGSASYAYGINNHAQVVGYSTVNANSPPVQAFIFSASGTVGLSAGTQAYGINDAGQVVGAVGSPQHAFLYSAGVLTDLGTLVGPPSYSQASGINSSGTVVGTSSNLNCVTGACPQPQHAFVWSAGVMSDLGIVGTPGGNDVVNAFAINDAGLIVGDMSVIAYKGGVLWTPPAAGTGAAYSITSLGAGSSALAINTTGDIAGSVFVNTQQGGMPHAAVWHAGQWLDLDAAIDPSSPFYGKVTLREAVAINDSGWIVATDASSTYVLSPQVLGFSVSSLSFGNQPVGTTSAAQPLTVTNNGSSTLAINAVTASSGFSQSNNCGATLPAGADCTIMVRFGPVMGGMQAGTVTLDTALNSFVIGVSGTGTLAVTLTATPTTTTVGNSVTLSWNGPIGASCAATGGISGDGWSGAQAPTGSMMVMEQVTQQVTYTITCTVATQSVQASTAVVYTVKPSGGGGGALDLISLLSLGTMRLLRNWRPTRKSLS